MLVNKKIRNSVLLSIGLLFGCAAILAMGEDGDAEKAFEELQQKIIQKPIIIKKQTTKQEEKKAVEENTKESTTGKDSTSEAAENRAFDVIKEDAQREESAKGNNQELKPVVKKQDKGKDKVEEGEESKASEEQGNKVDGRAFDVDNTTLKSLLNWKRYRNLFSRVQTSNYLDYIEYCQSCATDEETHELLEAFDNTLHQTNDDLNLSRQQLIEGKITPREHKNAIKHAHVRVQQEFEAFTDRIEQLQETRKNENGKATEEDKELEALVSRGNTIIKYVTDSWQINGDVAKNKNLSTISKYGQEFKGAGDDLITVIQEWIKDGNGDKKTYKEATAKVYIALSKLDKQVQGQAKNIANDKKRLNKFANWLGATMVDFLGEYGQDTLGGQTSKEEDATGAIEQG